MSASDRSWTVFAAGASMGVVTAAASLAAARYLSSPRVLASDKSPRRSERGDEPDDDSSQRPGGSSRGRRHKKHSNERHAARPHPPLPGPGHSPLAGAGSRKAQRALYLDTVVDDESGSPAADSSPMAPPGAAHLTGGQGGAHSVPSTPSHNPMGNGMRSGMGGGRVASHEDLTAVLASEQQGGIGRGLRDGPNNTHWIAQRYGTDHTLPSRANRGGAVIPFNVAPVATANSTNTQRDVDTADGGGDDLEDAERALGTNDRGADDASHLHMLTHHAKKRDAEYKSPASAVAEAPISLEEYDAEYTEAEGDDEMADETEIEDGAETDMESMPHPHDAPSLVAAEREAGRMGGNKQPSGPSDRANRWGAEMARMGQHVDTKKAPNVGAGEVAGKAVEEGKAPPLSYCRLEHNQQFELNAEGLEVCELLQEALELRRGYVFSRANEPDDGSGLGGPGGTSGWSPMDVQQSKDDLFEWDDANVEATPHTYEMVDGVMVVFDSPNKDKKVFSVPRSANDFFRDMHWLLKVCASGPVKTMCHHRLLLLEQKFNLHVMLNADQEFLAQKTAPHRDFYNIRKVDTHVHHSASFNQKHLLRFIKSKLRKEPDEVVIYRDGKYLTLREVFESLHLTGYDLNVDTLDMHADSSTFHRFDKFNLKYNPCGQSRLREIFIKQDNLIHGRFLAELTKEVFGDLESQKYTLTEYRISVYGRKREEWDGLAAWIFNNRLHSEQNVWLIQIPRLFQIYKAQGTMNNFQEMLDNLFLPLFEVTKDPSSHPNLHLFLKQVVGFDMVDDESRPERRPNKHMRTPKEWDNAHNPAYGYYAYYIWANVFVLNKFRESKGYSTFYFRPHAGEAGDIDHLASSYLLANEIAHGNNLRKSPGLQYLFYLAQIGLAMSPLSNNSLFLDYHKNPFPNFFARGLNVSLSTDDPLQIHLTKEPLVEEYSIAAQVWKLTACDLCEIARNSVLQSGYPHTAKQHWVSDKYWVRGPEGNDIKKTNVPGVRMQFRKDVLDGEIQIINEGAKEWKTRSHRR